MLKNKDKNKVEGLWGDTGNGQRKSRSSPFPVWVPVVWAEKQHGWAEMKGTARCNLPPPLAEDGLAEWRWEEEKGTS